MREIWKADYFNITYDNIYYNLLNDGQHLYKSSEMNKPGNCFIVNIRIPNENRQFL